MANIRVDFEDIEDSFETIVKILIDKKGTKTETVQELKIPIWQKDDARNWFNGKNNAELVDEKQKKDKENVKPE